MATTEFIDSKTDVPEQFRTDDIHTADARTLIDMGYVLKLSAGTVEVCPGETLSRMEELSFVCRVMGRFTIGKVEASPAKATFDW